MKTCSECGKRFTADNPQTRTCGRTCGYDRVSRLLTKHGEASVVRKTKTPEYTTWLALRDRCNNPKNAEYENYGGRGIKVCERWESFDNFLADMGRRPPNTTIDRINTNGDYEPGNCRWADAVVQGNNRRNNLLVTAWGLTLKVSDWAKKLGVPAADIRNRLQMGWTPERALAQPKGTRHDDVTRRILAVLSSGPKSASVLRQNGGGAVALRRIVACGLVRKQGLGKYDLYEITDLGRQQLRGRSQDDLSEVVELLLRVA